MWLLIRFFYVGNSITGFACEIEGGAPGPAFRDVKVSVDYPNVFLTVDSGRLDGFTFQGKVQPDGTLAGNSWIRNGPRSAMSLNRIGSYCGL